MLKTATFTARIETFTIIMFLYPLHILTTHVISIITAEKAFKNVYLSNYKQSFSILTALVLDIHSSAEYTREEKIFAIQLQFNFLPLENYIKNGIHFIVKNFSLKLQENEKNTIKNNLIMKYNSDLKIILERIYDLNIEISGEKLTNIFFELLNLKIIFNMIYKKIILADEDSSSSCSEISYLSEISSSGGEN